MESNPTIMQALRKELSETYDYLWESRKSGSPKIILDGIENYIQRLRMALICLGDDTYKDY